MKQSSKTAFGGIAAALSVVLMFVLSMIPFMTYSLPALAGAIIVLIVIELDKKWAAGVYAAVSLLSLMIIPDKEIAVLYAAFFGYYPIIKALVESKAPKWLEWILKLILFEASITGSYWLMIKFMGIQFEDIEAFGKYAVPILLGIGTVTFVIYDKALSMLIVLYIRKWQKKFRRLLK